MPTSDYDGIIQPGPEWVDVPSLSTSAIALGGASGDGAMNAQAVALTKRTSYLFNYSVKINPATGNIPIGVGTARASMHIAYSLPSLLLSKNTLPSATNEKIGEIAFGATSEQNSIGSSVIEGYADGAWTLNSSAPSGFKFKTTRSTSVSPEVAVTIDSNKRLGINTTDIDGQLHVKNAAASQKILTIEGANGIKSWFSSETSNGSGTVGGKLQFTVSSASGEYSFANSSGEQTKFSRYGYVGVQVPAEVKLQFQMSNFGGLDGNTNEVFLSANSYWDDSQFRRLKSGFAHQLAMTTSGTNAGVVRFLSAANSTANSPIAWNEIFRITHTGNIGVGTSSPGYKHHVEGDSYSTLSRFGDAQFYATTSSGISTIQFDLTDALSFNRTTNKLALTISDNEIFAVNSAEGPTRTTDATTANGIPRKSQVEQMLGFPGQIITTAGPTLPSVASGYRLLRIDNTTVDLEGAHSSLAYLACPSGQNNDPAQSNIYYRYTNPANPSGSRSTTGRYLKMPPPGYFMRPYVSGLSGTNPYLIQEDAFQGHEHEFYDVRSAEGGGYLGGGNIDWTRNTQNIVTKPGFSPPRIADETRPKSFPVYIWMWY